jgi:hypothetical protein
MGSIEEREHVFIYRLMLLHINYRTETWAYVKTGISTLTAAEMAFVRREE